MKKSFILNGTFFMVLVIFALSCHDEPAQFTTGIGCGTCEDPPPGGGTVAQAPAVNSFSPAKGFAGTQVTIVGNRFSTTPSDNIVTFDGSSTPAQIISATPGQLVVHVPAGATYGPISVTVSGLKGTSSSNFEVIDIPLNGLVAYYPLDGNANDITAVPSNGTIHSAAFNTDRYNQPNSAFDLWDNTSGYINFGNTPELQITGAITLSAWVKLKQGSTGLLFAKGVGTSQGDCQGYQLRQQFNSKGTHYVMMRTRDTQAISPAMTVYINQWFFLTVTVDGTTAKYYRNGVLMHTNPGLPPILESHNGNFYIDHSDCEGSWFKGLIDDASVYNRALTDAEVTQLYQQNIIL